jgi:hypothetical protein
MPQIDLEPDAAVQAAAEWLAGQNDHTGRAVVPETKQRFGITALQVNRGDQAREPNARGEGISMRGFATISPTAWQTDVRKLRGDPMAIATFYHLTTSPHSTMIGIYPLPLIYLAHDLGSPLEGASKGLQRVIDEGICTYNHDNEIVWVHEMAASQVAARLSPKDNRVSSVAKQLAVLPICPISLAFYERYRDPFHFRDQLFLEEFERAFQGPSEPLQKPLRSKDKEKEQEKDQDLGQGKGKFGSDEEELGSAPARENEPEDPYYPRPTLEEGRRFLISIGVPANRMEEALHRLMHSALFPCDVEEWKREASALRGAA